MLYFTCPPPKTGIWQKFNAEISQLTANAKEGENVQE